MDMPDEDLVKTSVCLRGWGTMHEPSQVAMNHVHPTIAQGVQMSRWLYDCTIRRIINQF